MSTHGGSSIENLAIGSIDTVQKKLLYIVIDPGKQ